MILFILVLMPLAQLLGFAWLIEALNPVSWVIEKAPPRAAAAFRAAGLESSALGMALVAFVVALWYGGRRAEELHDRAFAVFNDEVLEPVRAPRAFDPLRGAAVVRELEIPLPWAPPKRGPRWEAWSAALRFTARELGPHPGKNWFNHRPATPFGWTLIMGPPGSGKSRLAVELARQMARRDLFGGDGKPDWRLRLGSWWRVQVRLQPCGKDDPWDAGWLLPGVAEASRSHTYPGWRSRPKAEGSWLDTELSAWRPRRPTLILLDDPQLNDAHGVVQTLEATAKHYRHPVRLFIVNQTAPAELGLRQSDTDAEWEAVGRTPPLIPPLLLADAARFQPEDIRLLRGVPGLAGSGYPLPNDQAVDRFLLVTRGNPLLVELGFRWFRVGGKLEEMAEDALLRDRVDRILEAMREAGLDWEKQFHDRPLAMATLADGAPLKLVDEAFPFPNEPELLKRLFPAETVDLLERLPPLKPEMIGDAFLRKTLKRTDASNQERLVRAAWKANPGGTLRSALRLGGRDDALGRLLTVPEPNSGLLAGEVALAFAEAGLFVAREVRPEMREFRAARAMQAAAAQQLAKLPPAEARMAVDRLLGMAEDGSPYRHFDAIGWLAVFAAALSAATDATAEHVVAWARRYFEAMRFRIGLGTDLGEGEPALRLAWKERAAESALRPSHVIILSALAPTYGGVALTGLLSDAAFAVMAARPAEMEKAEMVSAWRATAFLARQEEVRTIEAATRVEDEVAQGPTDRDMQFERARAWRCVTYAKQDTTACQRIARDIDDITEFWPRDRDMQLQRAVAWRSVVFALDNNGAACERFARDVDDIAAPWPRDRDMQLERAVAWRRVASAHERDAPACERFARDVDDITAPWPRDRDMQLERAVAWRSVAFAQERDAAACERFARDVDDITRPWPRDRDMQLERVVAWRCVAFAHDRYAAACLRFARDVDDIAAPWPGDRDMQSQRVVARRLVTFAHDKDAAACKGFARDVDDIAAPWPHDRDMQLERAKAWRSAVYACNKDAVACVRLVRSVDDIAAPWPRDRDMQLQRAQAWCFVAYAHDKDAAACKGFARDVDEIATPWPHDRDIQLQRAQAWRCVAFAHRGLPNDHRRAVEYLKEICGPFAGDPEFQAEVDKAARFRTGI